MPPTSSPVPRLSSVPSAVFTVHTIASRANAPRRTLTQRKGGHPVRFWVMSSPPPRHQSTSSHRATPRLSAILPASSPSSSSSPLPGGKGMAESQPGRAILCLSACRPSPPCRGASEYMRTPPKRGRAAVSHSRAVGLLGEKVCFGNFCAVVSL